MRGDTSDVKQVLPTMETGKDQSTEASKPRQKRRQSKLEETGVRPGCKTSGKKDNRRDAKDAT